MEVSFMEQTTRTHNLSKRLLSLLLAAVMILSLMMTNALITAFAYSGKDYTNNAELAAKLDNVFNGNVKLFSNTNATYPVGSREDINFKYSWAGYSGYQCYAYAQAVYYYLFGDVVYHGSSSYANSSVVIRNTTSLTYDSLNAAGVGCGAYVRTTNNSDGSYNGNYGHSMIILSYDKNNITILHGNADNNGLIKLESRSWNSFNTYLVNSSDRRVSHVVQPNLTKNSNYGNWFDDGTGFYAYIVKKDSWMSLQNMNGNVQLRDKADSYDPRQIWLFNRQSDLSYEIVNMYDGTCLDAYCHGTAPGTNVGTYTKNDQPAQRWFLRLTSNDDVNIIPSYCDLALDVSGNENNPSTNVMLWDYNNGGAQRYSIYKLDWDGLTYSKPAAPAASTISVKTLGTSTAPTVLQWTASPLKSDKFDERNYSLRIYKGSSTDGNAFVAVDLGTQLTYSRQLEAGTYTACIKTMNTKYKNYASWGNAVTFTVPCAHTWNSGTVTTEPTYFSSGIKTYKCNNCGEKKTETIPSLDIPTSPMLVNNVSNNGHTYSLYVAKMTWDEAKAWCESNGGYLCTITSEEEQATVQSIIVNQSSSWLGAERGPDNQFRWITCEPWSYANWSEGEPNSTLENCVHIKDNYEWNDYGKTNSSPNGFIMETGDTPTAIHTWDSGKVTKEATCAVPGNKTFICTVCGTSRTETIKKTSVHTWDDGYITKEPTCAATGNKTFICSVCGTTKTETIEKTTSHKWDSGKVTKAATEKTEGIKTYTCSVCGEQKTEPIPPVAPVEPINKPTVTVGAVTARAGEEIEVPVSIANNPGINTFSFGLDYDTAKLQLKDVTIDPALGGQFTFKEKAVWLNATDTDYNGTILTLTFTVAADAQEGDIPVAVTYQPGDIANLNEEDVSFLLAPGEISVRAYQPGDINGDNKVNNKDLTRLMKYLAGDAVTVSTDALDVNGDGKVNNKDLTRLMKYLAGDNVSIY